MGMHFAGIPDTSVAKLGNQVEVDDGPGHSTEMYRHCSSMCDFKAGQGEKGYTRLGCRRQFCVSISIVVARLRTKGQPCVIAYIRVELLALFA